MKRVILALVLSFLAACSVIKPEEIDPLRGVSPSQAYHLQQQGYVLLDVRTVPEFIFVGHPVGAVNIPFKTYPTWEIDPDFVIKVKQRFAGRNILVICRSGHRSRAATPLLRQAGLNAINVREGFEGPKDKYGHRQTRQGWRNRGLPWTY